MPTPARSIKNVTYDFSGQVVMVTGAARGQGRAHALQFADAGANLVIVDIDANIDSVAYDLPSRQELDAVAAEIEERGVECVAITCDVRDPEQIKATVSEAEARFGAIDVLINNAGIESIYPLGEMPLTAWDDMINTNLRGVFLCSQAVAPGMVERGRGKIINTGSTCSFFAIPSNAHYIAAKHGVIGLTKALALELAPRGVNVNAVCPAAIDTPMNEGLLAYHEDWISGLGKIGGSPNLFFENPTMIAPEEISYAMLWLASDAADFVTGMAIMVDGGCTIK